MSTEEYEKLDRKLDRLRSLKIKSIGFVEDFQAKLREEIRKGNNKYTINSSIDERKYNLINDMAHIKVNTEESRFLRAIFGETIFEADVFENMDKIKEEVLEYRILEKIHKADGNEINSNDPILQQHFDMLLESVNEYDKYYNKYINLNDKVADSINTIPMSDKKVALIGRMSKKTQDISDINLDNEELKKYLMNDELNSDEFIRRKKKNHYDLSWIWDHIFIDDYNTAIKIAENVSEKGFKVKYNKKSLSEDLLNNPEFLIELEQIGETKAKWKGQIVNEEKPVKIASIGKDLSENKEFLMDMLSPFNLQVCKWASEKIVKDEEFRQKSIDCYSEAYKLGDTWSLRELERRDKRDYWQELGLDKDAGYKWKVINVKKQQRFKELEELKEKYHANMMEHSAKEVSEGIKPREGEIEEVLDETIAEQDRINNPEQQKEGQTQGDN